MTTPIADPTLTFKDLLKDNWVPGNTSGITPTMSTGWYDKDNPNPHVAVPFDGFDETLLAQSGYNAMTPAGPSQMPLGTQLVVAFTHKDMVGLPTDGPKELVWQIGREAQRIVHANVDALAEFLTISPGGLTKQTDRDKDPPLYMTQFLIGYSRFEDP